MFLVTSYSTRSIYVLRFVFLQPLSRVWLFVTTRTAALWASLSFTVSRSLLKFISIKTVRLSNSLTLCFPLFLLPSIFPSIRVFYNELTLHQVARVWELQLQHQSFQRLFRVDLIFLPGLISVSKIIVSAYLLIFLLQDLFEVRKRIFATLYP